MKGIVLTALLVNFGLYADWNPKECLKDDPSISFEILEDPTYNVFKDWIAGSMKESMCTPEKAKMIMDVVALTRPKSCVEIGIYKGSSFLCILTALRCLRQGGHAIGVDAWSIEKALKGIPMDDPNYNAWAKADMEYVRTICLKRLLNWSNVKDVTILEMTSERAAAKVGAIDFLHLDGSFSEEGALLDAQLYLPKVKSGGYILLSNMLYAISGETPKMKAMWALYDECDVVSEIESSNTVLFRKQ